MQSATENGTIQATGSDKIRALFSEQKKNRFAIAQTTARQRIARLRALHKAVQARRDDIHAALYADFKKPAAEVDLSEILVVNLELKHAIRHLKKWMKPKRVRPTLAYLTTRSWIRYEPRGCVLIISPWNFPFNLTLGPLISAIAAGNTVMLKPSEHAPHTARLIESMLQDIFPENEVAVVQGEKEVAEQLIHMPFDHIFFTGSPQVGKIVMKAAAENLTTVTLELGGKSPIIIDASANIRDAAQKVAWGKYINNGQTCIAPDYALVHESVYAQFISAFKEQVTRFFGHDEQQRKACPDYARIINTGHHKRLQAMLTESVAAGARLEQGGTVDEQERYMAPTLLTEVPAQAPVLQQEIFGPILPVMRFTDLDEVIDIINSKEKPLALYIFSANKKNIRRIIDYTSAGSTCINDLLLQFMHPNLPFGGVNHSGFGNAHGFYGFRAFSHERAILQQSKISPMKLMYPPYSAKVKKLIELATKYL